MKTASNIVLYRCAILLLLVFTMLLFYRQNGVLAADDVSPKFKRDKYERLAQLNSSAAGELRVIAMASNDPDEVADALFYIRCLNLSQLSRSLVDRIDFFTAMETPLATTGIKLPFHYPFVITLIELGRESMAPAIDLLASSDDPRKRTLAIRVVRGALGSRNAGETILMEAAKAEKDAARKKRLENALEIPVTDFPDELLSGDKELQR